MTKYALVTGANGQDGSYLMELLLEKEYIVYGTIRRSSYFNTARIEHLRNLVKLVYCDVTDQSNLVSIITGIKSKMDPEDSLEIYNLAAQSHVAVSFEMPNYTTQTDAVGTLNILEAIRITDMISQTKFYQASTSEMFGKVQEIPQSENTPFYPRSPYGVAKLYAHWITKNYRESYGLFACSGILFNHSSPRRGENFILRKISLGIAKIKNGTSDCIYLGNLDAKRDIGHSKDFVRGMWMMLQQSSPYDYVLATGTQYTIREFVEMAFSVIGITIKWQGSGLSETGYNADSGEVLVKVSEKYYRPCEVESLLGCPDKANGILHWTPEIDIQSLITEMVNNDLCTLN